MFKKSHLLALIFVGLLVAATGCIEKYMPDIGTVPDYLVVEAILANQPGESIVKLSKSLNLGAEHEVKQVTSAIVYVVDSRGERTDFTEAKPGEYQAPEGMAGQTGEAYQLFIETADGEVYQSQWQEMPPHWHEFNVEFNPEDKKFYRPSMVGDRLYESEVGGVFVNLDVLSDGDQQRYLRFTSLLTLQYVIVYQHPMGPETYDYCWINRNVSMFLNSNLGRAGLASNPYMPIAFIPELGHHMIHLGFPQESYTGARILTNSVYSINYETYNFHKEVEKQLSGEGRFFDPIASELTSNISCVTDPEKKVFGFFEASAVKRNIMSVTFSPNDDITHSIIDNVDRIPRSDCLYMETPDFWVP